MKTRYIRISKFSIKKYFQFHITIQNNLILYVSNKLKHLMRGDERNRHAAFTFHILHHDAKSTLISGYLLSFP